MADGESAQKPSAGSYSVSPFVKKEVHDQIANRSAKARVSWNWYDTWHEEHHRAFVVAKLCKADLLQEVHDSLQKAIDEGQTFEEWRKEIQPKLEGRWLGRTVGELWDELPEAEKKRLKEQAQKENRQDPEPNEKQRQEVISPKRLETIYGTNMKVAHVAGQYQSLVDEAELYPYWQYHTQEDERVRGSHAVLNRKVFRWDDPFWNTHFPPNGWQCRCYVRSLDDDDLEEKGLKVTDSRDLKTREDKSAGGHSKLTYIIDGQDAATADGWNYNPGKVNQQIDAVADDKIGDYEPELGQQVKDDLKKEEEPKPAAPKQPSAASGQPAKPSEPAKQAKPEKKAVPKSAKDKTEEPKASGKSETKPAAMPAKPEAAAPKSAQQTVKDSNVPVKSTAAASKPDAAPKPKQADGAHGKPKPATEPKLIKPSPAPINKPAAPRIIEPIKPADPLVPRVVKPIEPIDPSVHRVVEPVKPEAKQSILQTIRGKVSRAVDRVLGWLGMPSKRSAFEKLANEGGQDAYYGNFQPKESQSTVAKNATTAQSQIVAEGNIPPSQAQEIFKADSKTDTKHNEENVDKKAENERKTALLNKKAELTAILEHNQKEANKYSIDEHCASLASSISEIPQDRSLSPDQYRTWVNTIIANTNNIYKNAKQLGGNTLQTQLDELYNQYLSGNITLDRYIDREQYYIARYVPMERVIISSLPNDIAKRFNQLSNTQLDNNDIAITNIQILHLMRPAKQSRGSSITLEDLTNLPQVFKNSEYYIEHPNINDNSNRSDDEILVLCAQSSQEKKVLKICITPNRSENINNKKNNSIRTITKIMRHNVTHNPHIELLQ